MDAWGTATDNVGDFILTDLSHILVCERVLTSDMCVYMIMSHS